MSGSSFGMISSKPYYSFFLSNRLTLISISLTLFIYILGSLLGVCSAGATSSNDLFSSSPYCSCTTSFCSVYCYRIWSCLSSKEKSSFGLIFPELTICMLLGFLLKTLLVGFRPWLARVGGMKLLTCCAWYYMNFASWPMIYRFYSKLMFWLSSGAFFSSILRNVFLADEREGWIFSSFPPDGDWSLLTGDRLLLFSSSSIFLYLLLDLIVGLMISLLCSKCGTFSSSSSRLPSLNLGEFSPAAPSELFSMAYSFWLSFWLILPLGFLGCLR